MIKVAAMFGPIDTKNSALVRAEAEAVYGEMYPDGDRKFVARAFDWAEQCFNGRYDDFLPIDARYHDWEHTMQGTLCLVRLLRGRHRAGAKPELPRRIFDLGLLAILFHDTGYLKRKTDEQGSGAKYTAVHVSRSTSFAAEFLARQGYAPTDIQAIQNMIRCTGVNANLSAIPFQSEMERMMGYALGTADLLGQMADSAYVEKLPVLYQEFAEASRFDPSHAEGLREFASADDLIRKTPAFWRDYVVPRINNDFEKLYTFLNVPYPGGQNAYVEGVEANIERLARGRTSAARDSAAR